jgi:hypothetical protein
MSENPIKVNRKNVTSEVYARILKPKVREYGGEVSITEDGTITVEVDDKWKPHIMDDLTSSKD